MSENAKQKRWGIWIIAILGLLLIYALSIGPVTYLIDVDVLEYYGAIDTVYAPLIKTSEVLHATWILDGYLSLWTSEPDFATPYRVDGGVI